MDSNRDSRVTQYSELLEAFCSFDIHNVNLLNVKHILPALKKLGCNLSDPEIKIVIKAADIQSNTENINFSDFKRLYQEVCKIDPRLSAIGNASVSSPRSHLYQYGASGDNVDDNTLHSISEEEQVGFSSWIEKNLKDDNQCKSYFPFEDDGKDLYNKCKDGILLCKIINCSVPNTIDLRAMNKNQTLTTFQMHENITLALNSARAIGCNVVNIGASDIWNGTKHLLLGLLWQVIKIGLLKQINIVAHAELATLLEGDETITDFAKLSPENILIRWVNFHLNETESETRMENFSFDVRNSEVYAYLVEKITPQEKKPFMHSAQAILDAVDLVQRAEMVLQNAEQLNCRVFVRPEDIVSGSQRLNLAFLANLFHGYPALEKIPEVEEIVAEIGETREEKTYRNWINSMGLTITVTYLFSDLNDGLVLLKLFDLIKSQSVDWSQIHEPVCQKQAKANFQCLENCNHVIKLGLKFGFSLVGVAGSDLYEGKPVMTLALLWQLMRAYTLSMLTQITESCKEMEQPNGTVQQSSTKQPIGEIGIIEWANTKLLGAKKINMISKIYGFGDSNLNNGLTVIDLIDAIRPGLVDYGMVVAGQTQKEKLANAQYAITLARRIGATVYAVPEDLVEMKQKMIMTIFACLMMVDLKEQSKLHPSKPNPSPNLCPFVQMISPNFDNLLGPSQTKPSTLFCDKSNGYYCYHSNHNPLLIESHSSNTENGNQWNGSSSVKEEEEEEKEKKGEEETKLNTFCEISVLLPPPPPPPQPPPKQVYAKAFRIQLGEVPPVTSMCLIQDKDNNHSVCNSDQEENEKSYLVKANYIKAPKPDASLTLNSNKPNVKIDYKYRDLTSQCLELTENDNFLPRLDFKKKWDKSNLTNQTNQLDNIMDNFRFPLKTRDDFNTVLSSCKVENKLEVNHDDASNLEYQTKRSETLKHSKSTLQSSWTNQVSGSTMTGSSGGGRLFLATKARKN